MADKLKLGQKVADWDAAYDDYLARKKHQRLTRDQYAKELGVNTTYLYTNFHRIERERLAGEIGFQLTRIAAKSLKGVQESLTDELDVEQGITKAFKRKHELAVAQFATDRAGFSPQAVTVNVQQNNQQNVVMPPIFGGEYQDGVKGMLDED